MLYIVFGPTNPSGQLLDLSSLLYDSSSVSKVMYFLFLFSSISSVCISLTRWVDLAVRKIIGRIYRILAWGRHPIIDSLHSLTFFKMVLLILTKVLIQAYLLSMAIKSLMFYMATVVLRLYITGPNTIWQYITRHFDISILWHINNLTYFGKRIYFKVTATIEILNSRNNIIIHSSKKTKNFYIVVF